MRVIRDPHTNEIIQEEPEPQQGPQEPLPATPEEPVGNQTPEGETSQQ